MNCVLVSFSIVASHQSSSGEDDSDSRSEVYSPFTRAFASVIASHDQQSFPSLQELNDAAENPRNNEDERTRNNERTRQNSGSSLSRSGREVGDDIARNRDARIDDNLEETTRNSGIRDATVTENPTRLRREETDQNSRLVANRGMKENKTSNTEEVKSVKKWMKSEKLNRKTEPIEGAANYNADKSASESENVMDTSDISGNGGSTARDVKEMAKNENGSMREVSETARNPEVIMEASDSVSNADTNRPVPISVHPLERPSSPPRVSSPPVLQVNGEPTSGDERSNTPRPAPTTYQTVTDLILSKRKEYLAGIRKQEARIRSRRRLHHRNIRHRIRLGWATSDSSSDSGDNGDNDSSSSGDSNKEYQAQVAGTLDRLREQRRQHHNLEIMGRLRYLRSRLDTEDEDAILSTSRLADEDTARLRVDNETPPRLESVPSTSRLETGIPSASRLQTGTSDSENDPQVVVDGIIGLPESTGQFTVLHDTLVLARNTGTSLTHCGIHTDSIPTSDNSHRLQNTSETNSLTNVESNRVTNGETSPLTNGDMSRSNDSVEEHQSSLANGATSDETHKVQSAGHVSGDAENGVESSGHTESASKSVNSMNGDGRNNDLVQASTSKEPQPSTSAGPSGEPSASEENTWAHFKRFKNKVEKVRRNYRKRKHQDD